MNYKLKRYGYKKNLTLVISEWWEVNNRFTFAYLYLKRLKHFIAITNYFCSYFYNFEVSFRYSKMHKF